MNDENTTAIPPPTPPVIMEQNNKPTTTITPPPPSTTINNSVVMDLPNSTLAERNAIDDLDLEIEIRRRATSSESTTTTTNGGIPTLSHDIRNALRSKGEVIRYFGENDDAVRQRLKWVVARAEVLAEKKAAGGTLLLSTMTRAGVGGGSKAVEAALATMSSTSTVMNSTAMTTDDVPIKTTYTHASSQLLKARDVITEYSLSRSRQRLTLERRRRRGGKMRATLRSSSSPSLLLKNNNNDNDTSLSSMSKNNGNGKSYEREKKRSKSEYDDETTMMDDEDNDTQIDDTTDDDDSDTSEESTNNKRANNHHHQKIPIRIELNNLDDKCRILYKSISNLGLHGSQYGDSRPLSSVCTFRSAVGATGYGVGESLVATGGWTGSVRLWSGYNGSNSTSSTSTSPLEPMSEAVQGHDDRITGLAVSTNTLSLQSAMNNEDGENCNNVQALLATTSIDLTGALWTVKRQMNFHNDTDTNPITPYVIEPIAKLIGHQARLCRTAFHPSGLFVGTTSFDHTWRLWDVERCLSLDNMNHPTAGTVTGSNNSTGEVLLQDGHTSEVYGIGFHGDGALVSTTDYGGVVRVWDIRTGRSICHFLGHAGRVLCSEFSPSGFQLASSGDDGTIRIWDLRQRRSYACIPAHSRLVSCLKFAKDDDYYHHRHDNITTSTSEDDVPALRGDDNDINNNCSRRQHQHYGGEFLVSSSFDGTAGVWSTRDWTELASLSGHDGKVTGVDILPSPLPPPIVSSNNSSTAEERRLSKVEEKKSLSSSPLGLGIVTCGYDKTLKVWM